MLWDSSFVDPLLVIVWGILTGGVLSIPSAVAAIIGATYIGGRSVRTYFGVGKTPVQQ
ncbi:MAG: hypothetical protein ABSG92_10235 [Conexivisphaerales archaeon]|jgi:hypothetical protein